MDLTKQDIQAEAVRLGFWLTGVVHPEPPPHTETYLKWVRDGYQAEMGYLATERAMQMRINPDMLVPECRSILMLGIRYPDPSALPAEINQQPTGRVASYAWGEDYHDLIPARLKKLIAFLEANIGGSFPYKIYTDTGPILERDLAQAAGLGWAGKNTCLIAPRHGSFFLLAELFLPFDLESDPPLNIDYCGSCRRCIEACPTGCIRPDRTLDAGRCISYLTIENKGSIPLDLRPQIGNWVFGCDVCQMVCPWNIRFSDHSAGFDFNPRLDVPRPVLQKEIRLSPQEFNRKFKNSPLQRSRRRGYLRNVAVAIGNSGDPGIVLDLKQVMLEESEPLVRGHAAWALGRIDNLNARKVLEAMQNTEMDPTVRTEIDLALAEAD